MAEEPTSTVTKKYVSAANSQLGKPTKATSTALTYHTQLMSWFGHLLTGVSAIGAALLSSSGLGIVQLMESQALSTFFQLRGPIAPPENIVILAIDNQSISVPEQYYKTDPQQYAYLEPLKSFPFKRAAYADVIRKLMQAGAKSVAVDVIFDTESAYGAADDRQLQAVLQKYGSKVTLASVYETSESHQGTFNKLTLPQPMFRIGAVSTGTVNFPLEVDGKIHRLASEFNKSLAQDNLIDKVPSFDEAALRAARIKYSRPKGDRIHFWGPEGTFEAIPFWYVLDPQNWKNYLQQGKVFKNKIVVIGATAQLGNDYHPVVAGKNWLYPERMSGVEIHANAIATLIENKAIAQGISSPPLQGVFVLGLVGGVGIICARRKRGISRLIVSIGFATLWGGISYVLFVHYQLIYPTTVPMVAIAWIGLSYLGTEIARESIKKRQLVDIFQKYKTSPVVQEIISQQQDLQDLLQQRDLAVAGKILGGRYRIVKVLGSGGFSETYIAEDLQRPGHPQCVVKQLKPANSKATGLQLARRLFNSEAQTLEKLGKHHQIPQLLAYFEQQEEFYLVQEFIIGHPLSKELPAGQSLLETTVIELLRDLLQTLAFVHQNGVIHRDIKPSNIIRRHSDWKLVLIDFGAVKEVSTIQTENHEQTPFTIGIGTKGYAPNEQCFGRPQYSSDIYAVGMIGIRALTGIAPHELARDADGELQWREHTVANPALAEILSKMVLEDYKQRYQSASAALKAVEQLIGVSNRNFIPQHNPIEDITAAIDDPDAPTTPWEV
ncbi:MULTISPECIES: serine/threonine-protein kinase [unclassified Tolypothrix]|uniref:serine/threonine-protein kinase n=1 Tax=unclassified Tolypothrix TaxID=2649714 RepID=UPI0005EAC167|nr:MULTISPECIES: serine/threonine-protein kinase [unclassified Tolypothrix]BAY90476.1 serine/threonine protein kinase with Chase2 sensor [Microchaete diplosiphon NIES-3275]EKF01105.1 kinase domain protein [Tolypothrix sp. PCC 7601]MBE9082207.1 CHASE2 domain-containing protein [Tolypothrix sp. LEGE 11397]UYD24642.1 CHASE2 domain-containing protein [Tolypothrix sp. PCC 7712]UYD33129.1 CHASE2 domain-containing protein [Tolypothrix sp. PCC 7601]